MDCEGEYLNTQYLLGLSGLRSICLLFDVHRCRPARQVALRLRLKFTMNSVMQGSGRKRTQYPPSLVSSPQHVA